MSTWRRDDSVVLFSLLFKRTRRYAETTRHDTKRLDTNDIEFSSSGVGGEWGQGTCRSSHLEHITKASSAFSTHPEDGQVYGTFTFDPKFTYTVAVTGMLLG